MKKLISLALVSTMLLTFTACDNKENPDISNNFSLEIFEPIPVPEGGWTIETAAGVFCIDGKPIPYPLTVESLGKEYSIKKADTKIDEELESASTILYKNNIPILNLAYNGVKKFNQLQSAEVYMFATYG